ncbi:hypothetical protein JZ751_018472, partial [Albula glossodonta]
MLVICGGMVGRGSSGFSQGGVSASRNLTVRQALPAQLNVNWKRSWAAALRLLSFLEVSGNHGASPPGSSDGEMCISAAELLASPAVLGGFGR